MRLFLQMSKLQETTSYFDENAGRVGVKTDTVGGTGELWEENFYSLKIVHTPYPFKTTNKIIFKEYVISVQSGIPTF